MKHFSDEGCNKCPDYDKGLLNYETDDSYERSSIVHFEPDPDDWFESTIHHFQD